MIYGNRKVSENFINTIHFILGLDYSIYTRLLQSARRKNKELEDNKRHYNLTTFTKD